MPDARSLDHLIVYASNLVSAAECYRRLGFRVLPVMEHVEIGTSNTVVILDVTYLELLGDLVHCRHEALSEQIAERVRFGDGLYMTSFTSESLETDRKAISRSGIGLDPVVSARRRVRLPAGGWDETDSHSMYAWNRSRALMSCFLSEHRRPELIWIPEYRCHPNTAERLVRLTYVAGVPSQDRDYLTALIGFEPEVHTGDLMSFRTPRGELLEVISPAQSARRYGPHAPVWAPGRGGYGIACMLEVTSLVRCRWALRDGGVPFVETDGVLRVGAAFACGMVIEFRECG